MAKAQVSTFFGFFFELISPADLVYRILHVVLQRGDHLFLLVLFEFCGVLKQTYSNYTGATVLTSEHSQQNSLFPLKTHQVCGFFFEFPISVFSPKTNSDQKLEVDVFRLSVSAESRNGGVSQTVCSLSPNGSEELNSTGRMRLNCCLRLASQAQFKGIESLDRCRSRILVGGPCI